MSGAGKGRVVVVGAVRMDIPREDFFRKEISVVISRSYGPGRYDPRYEEGGNDYPAGYVRFTEQRNMQTVIDLIASGGLDVKSLITHRFPIDEAPTAYKLIEGEKTVPYLGIIITYAAASGGGSTNGSANQRSPQLEQRTVRPFAPSAFAWRWNWAWQAGQVMIMTSLAGRQRPDFLYS